MRFTLRQLKYFVAVGETGSITRAAARVNISQPSISVAIAHLESEFAVPLFVRHHAQGLSLTPAGRRLLHEAKRLLQQAHELYDIPNTTADTVSGPISVGSFRTLAPLIMPGLWKGFVTRHPAVEMRVSEESEAALLEGLRTARLDVALTYDISLTDDMEFEPVARLSTYVLLAADHPLAGRDSVSLAELKGEPFILLDLPLSRQYFMSLFATAGVSPHLVCETPNPASLRAYVAEGLGYSLLTARPVNPLAESGRQLAYPRVSPPDPSPRAAA